MNQNVSIRLFGMLAERASWNETQMSLPKNDIDDLKQYFEEQIPQLKGMDFTIAVDQKIVTSYQSGKEINEIALLPPFAGG